MLRLILGVTSVLALAWWKRNIIQAFFDDWYARDVAFTVEVETESSAPTAPTTSEPIEETEEIDETDETDEVTVYVTASGTRYHQAGCRSVSENAIAMPLSEAADQYAPCSRCNGPA